VERLTSRGERETVLKNVIGVLKSLEIDDPKLGTWISGHLWENSDGFQNSYIQPDGARITFFVSVNPRVLSAFFTLSLKSPAPSIEGKPGAAKSPEYSAP
jgi:hypothetical protein